MGLILLGVGICALILLIGLALITYGMNQDLQNMTFDSVFDEEEGFLQ